MNDLIVCILITLMSCILTWLCIKYNRKDHPQVGRSSHNRPTPGSGGIAFIIACFVGLIYNAYINDSIVPHTCCLIMVSASVIAIIGFLDDRYELHYLVRLFVQLCVCGFLVIHFKSALLSFDQTFYAIGLTIFFSGFINGINFCDGLNGLLGTGTVIVCGTLVHFNPVFAPYLLPLIFALIGFLLFNWQGKIFMGDVGSSFIGFYIPAILLLDQEHLYLNIILVGHCLFVYLFDISTIIFIKLKKGDNIFIPHRDFHFHVLNKLGLSHSQITLIYSVLTLCQVFMCWALPEISINNMVYLYIIDVSVYFTIFKIIRSLYQQADYNNLIRN